jgi:hypothetical protein
MWVSTHVCIISPCSNRIKYTCRIIISVVSNYYSYPLYTPLPTHMRKPSTQTLTMRYLRITTTSCQFTADLITTNHYDFPFSNKENRSVRVAHGHSQCLPSAMVLMSLTPISTLFLLECSCWTADIYDHLVYFPYTEGSLCAGEEHCQARNSLRLNLTFASSDIPFCVNYRVHGLLHMTDDIHVAFPHLPIHMVVQLRSLWMAFQAATSIDP